MKAAVFVMLGISEKLCLDHFSFVKHGYHNIPEGHCVI